MIFRVKVWINGQFLVSGLYLVALFWLTACGGLGQEPLPTVAPLLTLPAPPTPIGLPTPTGDLPPTPALLGVLPPTATAVPSPTGTAVPPITLSADPSVPQDLVRMAQTLAEQNPAFVWVESISADVQLTLGTGRHLADWIYVVAAPFATVEDEISLAQVQSRWQQGEAVFAVNELAGWDTAVLNQPNPAITFLLDVAELSELAWMERPSLLIFPFHKLQPDLKLLRLDGVSPLTAEFDPATYPLTVEVNVVGEETAVAQFLAAWDGPASNWDGSKLTRVAMSGVTALTRATAFQMEISGILTPGQAVGPVLQSADIAHVSNEVSFTPDCPYPDPVGGTTFCSRDSYFELLTFLGVDVVELTGNHVNDWGTDAMLHSLDLYAKAGMAVFGGGADLASAQQPAFFEHNGNRIAFIGCNPFGPAYAWAGESKPGSRPCDADFEAQISQLAADGYLVIATLQYNEFYHYAATAQQKVDFADLVRAGATAVSGSQAHHAQGFAFVDGAFVHYGLGNLFFDQMNMLGTRQSFVDTYVFYDGRLLSVELWTGLIENYCCPREMTAVEREAVLTAVFQASDW
ncbi:CapA family protein [Candidatus Leptofilum sp.]|uniref:CapA family protein n=1 Tax=Candidatus Leptofilum sp. TaxID=3241576 RepID=UPI003B5AAA8D